MMKLIQSLFSYCFPLASPDTGPALHFAGCLRTLAEMSARATPFGTSQPAARCADAWPKISKPTTGTVPHICTVNRIRAVDNLSLHCCNRHIGRCLFFAHGG
jgi:hypothetical protein